MMLTVIESPFRGADPSYLVQAIQDSFSRGESPFASHAIYPQALNDNEKAERNQGMTAGWAWMEKADQVAVYVDYGISEGMIDGIQRAVELRKPIFFRYILVPTTLTAVPGVPIPVSSFDQGQGQLLRGLSR